MNKSFGTGSIGVDTVVLATKAGLGGPLGLQEDPQNSTSGWIVGIGAIIFGVWLASKG